MKAKYWLFSSVVFLLLISFIYSWKSGLFSDQDVLYIAVSGPMTGTSEANGKAMVQGIQLYLDQINQQGGIHGHPVELLIFDDQNQPELAKKMALEIATQHKTLAVIGHYTSSASIAAAPIYRQYGLPAISGSATADELTKGNDWYFRTIFNNSDQGALLANYVHKVLNYDDADILFDDDIYGSTLAESFRHTAKWIGLEIKHQWHFNNNKDKDSFKKSLKNMIATQQASPTRQGIIFLATHSTEAVEAITALRREGIDRRIQIIGADALSSNNFVQKFKLHPQERTQPGYYSDGVYTTSAFFIDLASERAQDFRLAFIKKYQQEPMITSALYYDAVMLAIDAIKKLGSENAKNAASLEEKRKQVKDNLWQLSRLEDAVEGATGSLYFDDNGDMVKSIPIGIYDNGKPIVALYQFQPLYKNVQNIDNLLSEVLEKRIFQINGKFMSLAQVVYVGIDFNDMSEIDTQKSAYTADFYLWFRFKDNFDDNNIEFVNLFNPNDKLLEKPVIEQSSQDYGLTTRTYRIKTQFKAHLAFHDYPLDQQILGIYLRHKVLTREKLIYVVDVQGMNPSQFGSQSIDVETSKFFSVGGWNIDKVSFFQSVHKNDSTLGITNLFGDQQRIEYSQFNASITIERQVLSFILKNLLPVIFLIVLGYFSFFMKAFPQKLTLGTNMIVAASLFHLKLSSELPNINYIILIEYFFYLVYLLAIFAVVVAIVYHLKEEEGDAESEETKIMLKHINWVGKIFYPLFLFMGVGMISYGKF